jgi:ABC-type Fe3+-hydroxamate transport system substrate-binding protein
VRRFGGRSALLIVAVLVLAGGCTSNGSVADPSATTPASSTGPRPASPAVVKIVEPKNGATEPASSATLEVSLTGAKLTPVTSQDISPTEGHLHVSVDDRLISMTSGLTQTLPDLTPGRHTIRVEFVAADHLPFDPRVVTEAFFEVK